MIRKKGTEKIKRFLTSPSTVISLIIITLITCVIGFFIPQITDKSPSYFELWKERSPYTFRIVDLLQLNKVYTSVWFLLTIFLGMISLGYSIYLQVRRNIIHDSPPKDINISGLQALRLTVQSLDINEIRRIFKRKRYSEELTLNNKQKLIFTKNSIGRWGSVIFHSGIFLIIVSAFITFSFQKRGFVQIIRGDIFSGKDADFQSKDSGVFVRNFDVGFKTHLSLFKHGYQDDGRVKALESSIVIIDNDGKMKRVVLSINEPSVFNGVKIYQSTNYGYTLSFVLRKKDGEDVVTHFNLDMAQKGGRPLTGKTDFPTTDYIFDIKFYPDITRQTFYITKPIVYLTISEAISNNLLFSGLLLPKHSIKIKDDILTFVGITEWSGLIFRENPGIIIAYVGFIFVTTGALFMFGFPYKEVHISVEKKEDESILSVYAHTRRYRAIFKEEVEKIITGLNYGKP